MTNETKLWALVKDTTDTIIGYGPLHEITEAQITRVLDGPGQIRLTVPAESKRVQDLVSNERRVDLYLEQPRPYVGAGYSRSRYLGSGFVRKNEGRISAASRMIRLSGPDQLEQLARRNVWTNWRRENTALTTVLAALMAKMTGWSATYTDVPDTLIDVRFDGASVLKAVQELVARYGIHLRWQANKTLAFGPLGDEALLRIEKAGGRLLEAAYDNENVAFVEGMTWSHDTEAVINRVVPLGGGQADAAVTLRRSTRAQDRTTVEVASYDDTSQQDSDYDLQGSDAYEKLAQEIEISADSLVNSAELYLRKVGTPTGTLTLRIETDSSGEPSGTLVNANATATAGEASLAESFGWIAFVFAGSFYLDANTDYWLVLSTTRSTDGSNYVEWGTDNSTPAYFGGNLYEYSGGWANTSEDALFRVYRGTESRRNKYLADYGFEHRHRGLTFRRTSARQKIAQRFETGVGDDSRVASVAFWMHRHGTLSGNLTVTIQTSSDLGGGNSEPSGTDVSVGDAASQTVAAASVDTDMQKVTFTFMNPPQLTAETAYWLVIEGTFAVDSSNFVDVLADEDGGYTYGIAKAHDGTSWNGLQYSACFQVIADCVVEPYEIKEMSADDGATLHYLEDAASVSAYGAIEQVVKVNLAPLANDTDGVIRGANAVYDTAAAYLQRASQKQTSYKVRLRKASKTLLPGQKVWLFYEGWVQDADDNDVFWVNEDGEFWVIKVEERVSTSGHTVDVTLSTVDLLPADVVEQVIETLEFAAIKEVTTQPVPGTVQIVTNDAVQASYEWQRQGETVNLEKHAEVVMRPDRNILRINDIRLYWKTYPLSTRTLAADVDGTESEFELDHAVVKNANYPAALRIYIDGTDVSEQVKTVRGGLAGPWLTGYENQQFDDGVELTEVVLGTGYERADNIYTDVTIQIRCGDRLLYPGYTENLAVTSWDGLTFEGSSAPTNGDVQMALMMGVIVHPSAKEGLSGTDTGGEQGGEDDDGLKAGINNIFVLHKDGTLEVTGEFQSDNPAFDNEGLVGTLSGNVQQWWGDSQSPLRLGTGTEINGVLVTDNAIYKVYDITNSTGNRTVTLKKTFRTPSSGTNKQHSLDGNGVWGYVQVASTSGEDGIYETHSTDGGATWSTETKVPSDGASISDDLVAPGCAVDNKTPGRCVISSIDSNGEGKGYVTADYGASWSVTNGTNAPLIATGAGLAGDLHWPPAVANSSVVLHGYVGQVSPAHWEKTYDFGVDQQGWSVIGLNNGSYDSGQGEFVSYVSLSNKGPKFDLRNTTIGDNENHAGTFTEAQINYYHVEADAEYDQGLHAYYGGTSKTIVSEAQINQTTNYITRTWSGLSVSYATGAHDPYLYFAIESGDNGSVAMKLKSIYVKGTGDPFVPDATSVPATQGDYELYEANGATDSSIAPTDSKTYGPRWSRWAIDTARNNADWRVAVITRDGDSGARVYWTENGGTNWAARSGNNSDYRRAIVAPNNAEAGILWGTSKALGYTVDRFATIQDKGAHLNNSTEIVAVIGGAG